MRRLTLLLIAVAVLVFVFISAVLARAFSVEGAERAAITRLVQDEARGRPRAMVGVILGCARRRSCRERVGRDAATLHRPGHVTILELNPSAGFSLTGTVGTARVAWRAGAGLPVVQCVRVRRAGNVLSGLKVELLEISGRIATGANCPGRF